MELTTLVFLSSGLFLGWSLGANDAANVFGTAVGARMIRFYTAAIICGVFVILGAVLGGAGAAHGLGKLGSLNALAGAFTAALAAALTVFVMTRLKLPVSTTQAVVGAIVGWNFFSDSITDLGALAKIASTWVAAPILGAIFGALVYMFLARAITWAKVHLLRLDMYTRIGLILAGAFGSYALGANNIGNVMGVFVSSSPFTDLEVGALFTVTSIQQLFLLGSLAIAVGVITYSKRVMLTVGSSLMPLTPVGAMVVVLSSSLVLFLFSSRELEHFLVTQGLPRIPLIPVSQSQAVIGAVIGIGLLKGAKGARQIRWRVLGNIAAGWVATPIAAALVCFVLLFVLQNVFDQQVYQPVDYELSPDVLKRMGEKGIPTEDLATLEGERFTGATTFRDQIREIAKFTSEQEKTVISMAEIYPIEITAYKYADLDTNYLSGKQVSSVAGLFGSTFQHRWQLEDVLRERTDDWKMKPDEAINKIDNEHLQAQMDYVISTFKADATIDTRIP